MEGKFFKLRSSLNDLVLDVEGGRTDPGTRVTMWRDHGGDNQLWYEDYITGTIRTKLNDYCLEISGSEVCINPYYPDESNQYWVLADDRVHHRDDPSKVLDIAASNPSEGADLLSWDYHGGPNQIFTAEYIEPVFFFIVSEMNGKVMDVKGGERDPGTKVIMYDRKDPPEDNQLFYEDKYGVLRTKLNDFALDFDSNKIRINPYDGMKESQQWAISGDTIRLKSDPNQVIDIIGENSSNGAKLTSWEYHGNSNQRWTVEYI